MILQFQTGLVLLFAVLATSTATAEENSDMVEKTVDPKRVVYKTIDGHELALHVFEPPECATNEKRPAIVFFFGGGWNKGTPSQFYPHCEHLSSLGMVAMSAEYRIKSKHGTTPFECVKDAKSAVRWIRSHADELGIDPHRIAAGG